MKIYYNPKNLKQFSRNLRNKSTLSEVLLWNELKGRKIMDCQFMRQKPINNYIVDFFCSKVKLVLEVDGDIHQYQVAYDLKRQRELESLGLNVLRFDNLEVKQNMDNVLQTIRFYIEEFESTHGQVSGRDNSLAAFGKGRHSHWLSKHVMEHNLNSISKTKTLKTLTPQTHPHTIPLTKGERARKREGRGLSHPNPHTKLN